MKVSVVGDAFKIETFTLDEAWECLSTPTWADFPWVSS